MAVFRASVEGVGPARRKLAALGAAAKRPTAGLKAVGQLMKRESSLAFQAGRDPKTGRAWPASGGTLKRGKTLYETGRLANSVNSARPRVTDHSVSIGTGLVYAPIHHFGGTVKAKNAKNLAIPLTRKASRVTSPKNYAGKLFFIKSKRGSKFLAQSDKAGKLSFIYLLLASVRIPARPFFGLSREASATARKILGQSIRQAAGFK